MALLYGDLDLRESGADRRPARPGSTSPIRSSARAVRSSSRPSDVARARLLLAKEGLPSGGSIGYEIFDRGDGLTASQFQQKINQTRALEGELARTIRTIDGVRAARVHLVLPKREPFARDQQDAQASVVLDHGRRRAAGPRGRAGGPQPRRRRRARACGAEHRHHRQPRRRAGPRRRADRQRRRAQTAEEIAPRRRTAAVARRRGDARAHPRHRTCARRGVGRDGLRPRQRDRRNVTIRTARWCAARRTSATTRSPPSRTATVSVQNNLPNADAGGNGRRAARKRSRTRRPTTRSARPCGP